MPPKPLARALSRFGIAELRPGQREVIESVLGGRDTLAVMPSGAGKSLCYQVPAYCMPGTTVVVSPLIALMKDQAERLEEHGVDAAAMNSALSTSEEERLEEKIGRREAEIVYTTPERLGNEEFIRLLRRNPIDLFVVDEAHCISQWGHDFRPAYLEIAPALRALGRPPLLALTATATPEVIEDIRRHLERPELHVINTGVYREELFYTVRQVTSAAEHRQALAEALRETRGTSIVYCATVKAATAVHAGLVASGEAAELYHGQLGAAERDARQDRFMSGQSRVMVATNAFGMGIDKPDIRLVVHYQVPGSLEAYYQESGRAGRDGKDAKALLLYNHADRRIQTFFAGGGHPGVDELGRIVDAAALAAPQGRFTLRMLHDAGLDLPQTVARVGLAMLKEAGVVRAHTGGRYRLESKERAQIEKAVEAYRAKASGERDKLEQMVAYAHGARCRWRAIVEYFGESAPWEKCGHCDNCARPAEAAPPPAVRVRTTPKPPPLQPGDRVVTPRYGKGLVRAASTERVSVEFPDGSTREFLPRRVLRARD